MRCKRDDTDFILCLVLGSPSAFILQYIKEKEIVNKVINNTSALEFIRKSYWGLSLLHLCCRFESALLSFLFHQSLDYCSTGTFHCNQCVYLLSHGNPRSWLWLAALQPLLSHKVNLQMISKFPSKIIGFGNRQLLSTADAWVEARHSPSFLTWTRTGFLKM